MSRKYMSFFNRFWAAHFVAGLSALMPTATYSRISRHTTSIPAAGIYISILSFMLLSSTLWGQDQITKAEWEESLAKIVLVQKENLLPLRGLDTIRPFFISASEGGDTILANQLSKYQPQSRFKVVDQDLALHQDFPYEEPANILITSVHLDKLDLRLPLANILKPQSISKQIFVIYGDLNKQPIPLNDPKVSALIYAPDNTPLIQSQIAQIIYGGLGAKGQIPADLQERFGQDSRAVTTAGGLRLAYVPPKVAKMDGQLLQDSIQAILEQGIEAGAFPGAQVLVAKDGQVVYHQAFGHHTYDNNKPVQLDDIYDLASITKISSGLPALMRMYGQGQFDLDAPLKQYFPQQKWGNKADLSFRSMLAHNARIRPWIPYWKGTLKGNGRYPWKKSWDNSRINDYQFRKKTFSRDSTADFSIYVTEDLWLHKDYKDFIYKSIRKSPLNKEAGYRYSGLLFYLMPEMIAQLQGQDFEQHLKSTFYQPLGAYTITYNPLRFFTKDQIIPTENDNFFRMTQLHGSVHDEGAAMMGGISCNAGLFASTNDLAKLMQLYLNKGEYGGQQLIASEAVDEFTRCQYCEEDNRRGLGFDKPLIEYNVKSSSVAEAASPLSFGHSGYTGTFTWADPATGLLMIFMSNRVHPTRDNRKIYELNIRPRIHKVLYEAILE